jgi:hypothetical protein
MKWRPKWSTVTIALAVIAALAIASPALGISGSIKKAIRKEVSKQIANATGPAGANGTNGKDGTDGAPATKLFAAVDQDCTGPSRSSGGISVAISGATAGRCDITFPEPVAQCVPVVTLRQTGSSGELAVGGNQDALTLGDNQFSVAYRDSAGTLKTTSRQSFFIVVFC